MMGEGTYTVVKRYTIVKLQALALDHDRRHEGCRVSPSPSTSILPRGWPRPSSESFLACRLYQDGWRLKNKKT